MKSISLSPVLAGLLLGISLISLTADTAQAQDCSTDKAHEFDFWIGEWDVTAGGKVAGTNSVQPILDGCVLQETWAGASGSAGSSLNYYDPKKEQWEPFWQDVRRVAEELLAENYECRPHFLGAVVPCAQYSRLSDQC